MPSTQPFRPKEGSENLRPVSMDKHTLISFFTECIFRLEREHGSRFCFYRIIELCLVVGWLSAHDQFYEVLVNRWTAKLPSGNLALAYLKEMRELGGCGGGHCHRYQPHFNKDISHGHVIRSLACLASIVLEINSKEMRTEKEMRKEYKKAVSQCQKHVIGAGALTSQHVIHTLIFTGVLQVKPFFATIAVVKPGTMSYRRLMDFYPGSTPDRFDNLLVVVSAKLGVTTRVAEEMICNLGKSASKRNAEVEPTISGQTYRLATNNEFLELLPGTNRFLPYKLKKRDSITVPVPTKGECKWWLLIPLSTSNSSQIKDLKDKTAWLNKLNIPVIMPSNQRYLQSSVTTCDLTSCHKRVCPLPVPIVPKKKPKKKPLVHGLLNPESPDYVRIYGFEPTIWSPALPVEKSKVDSKETNATSTIPLDTTKPRLLRSNASNVTQDDSSPLPIMAPLAKPPKRKLDCISLQVPTASPNTSTFHDSSQEHASNCATSMFRLETSVMQDVMQNDSSELQIMAPVAKRRKRKSDYISLQVPTASPNTSTFDASSQEHASNCATSMFPPIVMGQTTVYLKFSSLIVTNVPKIQISSSNNLLGFAGQATKKGSFWKSKLKRLEQKTRNQKPVSHHSTRSIFLSPPTPYEVQDAIDHDHNIVSVDLGRCVLDFQNNNPLSSSPFSMITVKPLQPSYHTTKITGSCCCHYSSFDAHHYWGKTFGINYVSLLQFPLSPVYEVKNGQVFYKRKKESNAHLFLSILYDRSPDIFRDWLGDLRFAVIKILDDKDRDSALCVIFRDGEELSLGSWRDGFKSRIGLPKMP